MTLASERNGRAIMSWKYNVHCCKHLYCCLLGQRNFLGMADYQVHEEIIYIKSWQEILSSHVKNKKIKKIFWDFKHIHYLMHSFFFAFLTLNYAVKREGNYYFFSPIPFRHLQIASSLF